jgi:nitrogen regulatory protein P-II 2
VTTEAMTLLTIVAEDVLEQRLIRDLHRFGIGGYTITPARGEGVRGMREGATGANIRIETVTTDELASTFLDHLHERYFTNYAMVAWLSEVRVARPEKYRPEE